jgi:hypothetical protein
MILFRACLCASVLFAFAATARAQFRAGVQGTVTDPAGAVVTDANVTLKNNETGATKQATTSSEGFYRIAELPPGNYTLTVEKAGFKKSSLENVTVNAESVQGLDLVLTTGEVSETVTVTGETQATLDTENANVNKAVTTEEIRRLPQFGRDPYELLRLTPGIFGDASRGGGGGSANLPNTPGPGGSGNSIFQVENQPQITANGQRLSANNYQIDGVSVNSLSHGGAAVVTPNQESVKEVQVLSSTYSAEDGRNSGAQVKVVSQGGTNNFHGSLFLKANDPRWNAFNKYGPGFNVFGGERVNNRFKQFGGSIGGPLPYPNFSSSGDPMFRSGRDKAFFFLSYEGLRANNAGSLVTFVETPQFRNLITQVRPNGIAAQILNAAGIQPRIIGVLPQNCSNFNNDPTRCRVVGGGLDIGSPAGAQGQYLNVGSMGNGFDGIPDVQRVLVSTPSRIKSNQYNLRFDFAPRTTDTLTLSTYITKNDSNSSDAGSGSRPMGDLRSTPTNSAAMLTYVRTLSNTMVNEARFNFTRFAFNEVESAEATNFGIPRIEIESLPFDRIRFGAPQAETTPGIFAENQFEFRDVLNWVRSNQAWKFGGEIRWEQNNDNLNGGSRPLYTFGGLFNFANDTPLFYQINADPRTGGPANAQRYFRSKYIAGFAQNDWKFRPNLSINLGLRYEYFSPLTEARGQLSNLTLGQDLRNSRVVVVDELFKPDRNNFAPRLGFAWSPNMGNAFGGLLNENRAVIRGGFGISYNRTPNVVFSNSRGNPPFFARYQICCGTNNEFSTPFADGQILYALGTSNSPFSYPANPALAVPIDPATGSPQGRSVEIYAAQPDTPNAYVYTFSLEGQYDLGHKMVAELGYQGSSGHKLIRLVNQNFLYPNNPSFFAVFVPQPDVNSNYHGMNARLGRRFSNGYQFDVYYRLAKSIDTLSNEGPGAVTNQTFPQDLHTERGPSDFDVKHSVNISGLWDVPIFRNRKDAVGKILGGWQLSGITTWHTGFPWTPHSGRCENRSSIPIICPVRPTGFLGGAVTDTSNDAFITGIFPGNLDPSVVVRVPPTPNGTIVRTRYFTMVPPGSLSSPPGIGRNSFRGPRYFSVDLNVGKRTGLPKFMGEGSFLELRANIFNAFNNLNLAPFGFFSNVIEDSNFGRSERGLAGRVVEFQGRLNF